MDFIRHRNWFSSKNNTATFVDEEDLNDCVIEKILRNKFWDPLISDEEDEPLEIIDWDGIFKKENDKEKQYNTFVPGFRPQALHPKISVLTKDEQRQCVKVLSTIHNHILPNVYLGRPSKNDYRVFESKKEIYAKEQSEYIEWAKSLWISTNCIRALRPKPIIETVYEAEYKMIAHLMQSFPKKFALAAQIPLTAEKHKCDILFPKKDLVKVDISTLPEAIFPDIYEKKESILKACIVPEPCTQHLCKFKLPNEKVESMLPLTEIHKELAQYALEHDAGFIASENTIKCLLETDRCWNVAVSVCEVIAPDGEKSNIVVLGKEFPLTKDPAPTRSYRAIKHLLQRAFTKNPGKLRRATDCSDISDSSTFSMTLRSKTYNTNNPRGANKVPSRVDEWRTSGFEAATYNTLSKIVTKLEQSDDSDDENRLQIDMDDDPIDESQKPEVLQLPAIDGSDNVDNERHSYGDLFSSPPRKILKAQPRRSPRVSQNDQNVIINDTDVDKNSQNVNQDGHNINKDRHSIYKNEKVEIGLFSCVCKDTEFEVPPQRSFRTWRITNYTTKEHVNVIIHCSHKLKNDRKKEVILEPIVEYQLDIGGTAQSPEKLQSLAFSLLLRKNADLANVRVDGFGGELVSMDIMGYKELVALHGESSQNIANTIYTALNQLAGLLPGDYILHHDPSHGNNALLYCARSQGDALEVTWGAALPPAEEARRVQQPPRLAPVLLPVHKHRRQLPLAFTCEQRFVLKESTKPGMRKKPPPGALLWTKKKKARKNKKKRKTIC